MIFDNLKKPVNTTSKVYVSEGEYKYPFKGFIAIVNASRERVLWCQPDRPQRFVSSEIQVGVVAVWKTYLYSTFTITIRYLTDNSLKI